MPTKPTKLLMKQPQMKRMLFALTPLLLSAIYFFGWRAAVIWAVCNVVGFATEFIMCRRFRQSVSQACFVTCWLLALSLPVTTPLWVAAVGTVVAVLFGKMVFGGFGKNFVNPAILGRAFVYVCFPVDLTARFVPVFTGFPGGFAKWSFESLKELPSNLAGEGRVLADAISQASPMWANREYGYEASIWQLLLGNIQGLWDAAGQTRILSAGSMGEGCAVLVAIAAVYLLVTKTAKWQLMLGGFVGLLASNVLFRNVLGFSGLGDVPPLHLNLLSGTTMFALVFMVTDPVSAPKKKEAMLAYGFVIGFLVVLLRWRGVFVAAASFSILLGNIVGPLLDLAAEARLARRKARLQTQEGQA